MAGVDDVEEVAGCDDGVAAVKRDVDSCGGAQPVGMRAEVGEYSPECCRLLVCLPC